MSIQSKVCSSIDDHFIDRCEEMIDLFLDSEDKDEQVLKVHSLIFKLLTDSMQNFQKNKIKTIYMTVVINVLNQKYPFIVEMFISVLVRKFFFLLPIIQPDSGLISKNQKNEYDPSSDSFWNRHKHFSKMFVLKLSEEDWRQFEGVDRRDASMQKKYQKLLRKQFSKKGFETFLSQLNVYSALYFAIIGFRYNEEYGPLEDSGLLSRGNNMYAYKLYLFFFETVVSEEVTDPVMGIVLMHSLRLFADIWNGRTDEEEKKILATLTQLQRKDFFLFLIQRKDCPQNEGDFEIGGVQKVARLFKGRRDF